MKSITNRSVYIILIMLIGSMSVLYSANPPVTWSGTSVASAVDSNVEITSDILLPNGATSISAITTDVLVTIDNNAQFAQGDAQGSQLYLFAAPGHTITIAINSDFEFDGVKSFPLTIIQSGIVNWSLADGIHLSFGNSKVESPVNYYLYMAVAQNNNPTEYEYGYEYEYETTTNANITQATFVRDLVPPLRKKTVRSASTPLDVFIILGKKSIFGYLSPFELGMGQDAASFVFDPTNTGTGRMLLEISDQAAVIVSGRLVNNINPLTVLPREIRANHPAGGQAIFSVINSLDNMATAGLFVLNSNKRLSDYLYDPFLSNGARGTLTGSKSYIGNFSGKQFGFIVGANGSLQINSDAYLYYVGLTLNQNPQVKESCGFDKSCAQQFIKQRNPSALILDQSNNPIANNPQIQFGQTAGLFLASGVDKHGRTVSTDSLHAFTVDAKDQVAGTYVLDCEGDADIISTDPVNGAQSAKIELLSLEVSQTGGPLFMGGTETDFPKRTFTMQQNGDYYAYNSGAFLINGRLNIQAVSLVHTNENALVVSGNPQESQPTYIGGETFTFLNLKDDSLMDMILNRPKMSFINARFLLHTSAALTGVDILVPDYEVDGIGYPNLNQFLFAYNGYVVDNGNGAGLMLGTQPGSLAYDNSSIIDNQAHFDIIQTNDIMDFNGDQNGLNGDQTVTLLTIPNDNTIVQAINGFDITGQLSQHEIFLTNGSNISIGTNAASTGFEVNTHPWLKVAGSFFVFDSNDTQDAAVTGEGGIFVDLNGKFSISPLYDALINIPVVRSFNGIVDIPVTSSLFSSTTGVTNPALDLSDPNQLVVVAAGEHFSQYIIDWGTIIQNYAQTMRFRSLTDPFLPYPVGLINLAGVPAVTEANVSSIPTIQGQVDQLIIRGSRIGFPVHLKIDGGVVNELIFENSDLTGEANVAVVVLQNGGTIGLGATGRDSDSQNSTGNIGRNGVIIITNNGGGRAILNSDVYVEGFAPFLAGPDIGTTDTLQITSPVAHQINVGEGSVLDLRSFSANTLEVGGYAHIVMEPTSMLLMGGGTLLFNDNAKFLFDTSDIVANYFANIPLGAIDNTLNPSLPTLAADPHNQYASLLEYGSGLDNTASFRSSLIGTGTIQIGGDAHMSIPLGSFVGVETLSQVVDADMNVTATVNPTNLTLLVSQNGRVTIGHEDYDQGGVLQVGNTQDLDGHSIGFNLELSGNNARFSVGSLGVLGFNVGVLNSNAAAPSSLLVDTLFNVTNVGITINNGDMNVSRIWSTDDARANVMLVGDNGDSTPNYSLTYAQIGSSLDSIEDLRIENAALRGGSPLVYVSKGLVTSAFNNAGAVAPIVENQDGQVVVRTDINGNPVYSTRIRAGMVASTLLQNLTNNISSVDALSFFDAIKTQDAVLGFTPAHDKVNVADSGEHFRAAESTARAGGVANGVIVRNDIYDMVGAPEASQELLIEDAIDKGAAYATLDMSMSDILEVTPIPE